MLSSLPGKALRTVFDIAMFWYSIYQFTHCFTLQAREYDVIFDFCVDSASLATSFKK